MKPPYDLQFKKKAETKMFVKKFMLNPEYWYDVTNQLNKPSALWNKIKFEDTNKNLIPQKRGVYAFVLIPNYSDFIETRYLFYVGKTNRTLKQRFQEYMDERDDKLSKPREKVKEMLNMFEGHLWFHFIELGTASEVNSIEEKLLNTFVPHVNCVIPRAKIKKELKYVYE